MKEHLKELIGTSSNFIFLGEAGSGKSEISINACRCPMCTTILDAKAVQEFESKTGV